MGGGCLLRPSPICMFTCGNVAPDRSWRRALWIMHDPPVSSLVDKLERNWSGPCLHTKWGQRSAPGSRLGLGLLHAVGLDRGDLEDGGPQSTAGASLSTAPWSWGQLLSPGHRPRFGRVGVRGRSAFGADDADGPAQGPGPRWEEDLLTRTPAWVPHDPGQTAAVVPVPRWPGC